MNMTHNEFEDYRRKLASDYWNRKISIKQMNALLNAIHVVPYNFKDKEECLLSENTKHLINLHFAEKLTDDRNQILYKGFIYSENCYGLALKLQCDKMLEANNCYGVVYNTKELFCYSWAEGDIYITIFPSREAMEYDMIRSEKMYA